jgi:hypothetical protein
MTNVPSIDIIHDLFTPLRAVRGEYVVLDPFDKVVLEGTLDDLMEDIRGDQLVDVGPRESIGEWLNLSVSNEDMQFDEICTCTSSLIPKLSQS